MVTSLHTSDVSLTSRQFNRAAIAPQMGITEAVVANHIRNIRATLGTRTRRNVGAAQGAGAAGAGKSSLDDLQRVLADQYQLRALVPLAPWLMLL